jgi:hypothetical protein
VQPRSALALVGLVGLCLVAGCAATTAGLTVDPPDRNASLATSTYEPVGTASPAETRRVWDRSKSWEDPGVRNATVVSHALAYRYDDTRVVVYTTPAEPYADPDRIRTYAPAELATLAGGSVGVVPDGGSTGGYPGTLLGENVTVGTLVDGDRPTAHVARVDQAGAIVVVVVTGADRAETDRVLSAVTLDR